MQFTQGLIKIIFQATFDEIVLLITIISVKTMAFSVELEVTKQMCLFTIHLCGFIYDFPEFSIAKTIQNFHSALNPPGYVL